MTAEDFAELRAYTGRSQKELAQLLGVARKTIESYEQGWRDIPLTIQRMLYYLAFRMAGIRHEPGDDGNGCWTRMGCPEERKLACPAWQCGEGTYCWFITGNLCCAAHGGDCMACPAFLALKARMRAAFAERERVAKQGSAAERGSSADRESVAAR